MLKIDSRDEEKLIAPLFRTPGLRYWLAILMLLVIIGLGGYMYYRQLVYGLGVTGMNRPVYWGIYMVNFIFLIGVSMAGTLISAALQLMRAEWRSPVTRIAEALTVFGLIIATLQIFLDMGRPERTLYMFTYGRLQSPLLWDATSLTVYLLTSMFALYLQLMPDIALLRDYTSHRKPAWRHVFYSLLSIGWRGNREQWVRLEKVITVVSIAIIPIGVSLHTVTSWIFSTTVQPGWKSTILGPYFVVGAVFSGIGMLFIVMTLARNLLHLEDYIALRQFRNLGWLFIVMNLVWFYFTYTEHLTQVAEQEALEFPVLASKLWGEFSPAFWGMVLLMVAAFWIMVVPKLVPPASEHQRLFRTRFAFSSAGAAAVVFFMLVSPFATPFTGAPSELPVRTLTWVILGILLFLMGLGFSLWFKTRPIFSSVLAGAFVVVAMWIERWLIILPVVTHPRLVPYTIYFPTLTEISLTVASAGLLALMVLVFFRLFPAVSIWEISEQRVIEAAKSKIVIPLPEPVEPEPHRPEGARRESPRPAGSAARH